MAQLEVYKDHRVAELWGLNNLSLLSDTEYLLPKARSLAQRLGLNIVAELPIDFPPREGEGKGGLSLLIGIKESHLAFHTWELEDYMHIDAFTCSPYTNMERFREEILAEFKPHLLKTKKIRY